MIRFHKKNILTTTLLAALALSLSACGDSDASAQGAGTDEQVVINFGSFATGTASRQVLYAEEAGYFDEEGIDLRIESQQSTASIAQLTATGDFDLSYLTFQPAMSAIASGIDVKVLSTVQNIEPGMQTLWVAKDSGIESLADLVENGGSIAVASVGGFQELLTREALVQAGLNDSQIEFVGISPSEMIAALERGDIAAAGLTPPSRAGALIDPDSQVVELYDFADTPSISGLAQGGLWANEDFLKENPEAIDGFMRAVERAAAELGEDPELDLQYLADLGNLEPDLAAEMVLESWVGDVSVEQTQEVIDLMVDHDMLKEGQVSADAIVAE